MYTKPSCYTQAAVTRPTHCMTTCPRLNPHKATIIHPTALAAHNTCMACNLPSHDHKPLPLQSHYHTAIKPTRVFMHYNKATQPIIISRNLTQPRACLPHAHKFVWLTWMQGATTCSHPSQPSRVFFFLFSYNLIVGSGQICTLDIFVGNTRRSSTLGAAAI